MLHFPHYENIEFGTQIEILKLATQSKSVTIKTLVCWLEGNTTSIAFDLSKSVRYFKIIHEVT